MVRGETKKLTITVKDKLTGAVIDCSGATGLLVGLYHDGNKVIGKWSLVPKTGYGTIEMTNANVGIISVYLTVSETLEGIKQKTLKAEVVVSFNNPSYPSNKQISIDTNIQVEEIESSIFEGIDPTV